METVLTKAQAVIFDIDVVLAEKSPDRGYRAYDKVDLDKPVKETLRLLNYYANKLDHPEILFITGRKEYCRAMTIDWLVFQSNKNDVTYTEDFDILGRGLSSYHFDNLFMRGDTDHRKSEILKKEIYDNHIKDKYDVVAAFEDDPEVAQMYKKEGLFVFQVLR